MPHKNDGGGSVTVLQPTAGSVQKKRPHGRRQTELELNLLFLTS